MSGSPRGVMRTLNELQEQVRNPPREGISALKARLQVQKERYEKLKYRHSHSTTTAFHQLRQDFQHALNKLNDLNTRDVGSNEAKRIIDRNVSEGALKVFLSSLGEVAKMKSPGARAQDVLLVGYLAQVYGERLLETEGMKNVLKTFETIQEFFKDINRQVHEAAAKAWSQVYLACFPKDQPELFFQFVFDPLEIALTSGTNVKAQQGASIAMFELVMVLHESDEAQLLRTLWGRLLVLFLKVRAEYPDLISALGVLIELFGLTPILEDLYFLLNKLLQYLKFQGPSAHLYKIEACKLLECLAKQVQALAEMVMEPFNEEIAAELYKLRTDKLPAVQAVARRAYNQWLALLQTQREVEELKCLNTDD